MIIAALGGGAYFFMTKNDKTIYAITPLVGPAVQAVFATGTVEPTVMIPIAPRTGARLVQLLADEGAEVKKGDILGQLEDTDVQKSIDQLNANLDLAQKEFDRKDKLRKSGAVSKQAIDSAKGALDAATAALEQAKAQQDYLRLVAPEDGRIIKRDGEAGQFIPSGQAVFWMECCAPLRITADVDEEDVPLVKIGQDVIITADAFPDETYNGKIVSITPKGDPISRSYRVRISLDADTPFMTGMTAEANIIIRKDENAILLPSSTVKSGKIWTLADGKIQVKKVKSGAQAKGTVEILEGIDKDDLVLESPDIILENGQSVDFKKRDWKLQE